MTWLPETSKLISSRAEHAADLRPPMSLNDRMYYLAQALTSAKSAASLGSEDVEFTSSLQERIDVAQVQTEVERAIAGHKEMAADEKNESLKQLDSRLLGLDEVSLHPRDFRWS
jgi:nuclear pore complex protein Nup155